jgi:hypothetical protein
MGKIREANVFKHFLVYVEQPPRYAYMNTVGIACGEKRLSFGKAITIDFGVPQIKIC